MEAVGILLLVAAVVFSAEGAACPVSIPYCYRKSTLKEEDFTCELEDRESTHGVKYILFIESRSFANAPPERVKFESRELIVHVPLEYVLTGTQSDIWVERQKDNINCSSNKTTVILKHLVKYSSPDIQKKVRSAGNLMLSWPKTEDNKGAIHEIRWKKINASWQNDTFETEDNKTDPWDSYRLPLQIHSVYQVQIRRKTKQYHIWSEWSNTVDVPVEIKAPVVHWRQEKKKGRRKVTLKWDVPPPEASSSGVTYNLTLNFPCKTKNKTTKETSYSLTAADSELRVSIIAINDVSTSPFQEIIIPPVQHLKHCHTSLSKMPKKHCLEWYKLVDGETRTSHVNTSTRATVKSIKNGMEKFVRYYYFIHTGQNRHRTTISMCPIYSEEGAPVADPHVTVVNVTENSAVLTWVPIPVQDQHGFLLHYAIWISRGSSHMAYFEVAENQTRFLLSNLSKDSSYTVYIAGRTKAGAGPNATEYFSTRSGPFFIHNSGFSKIILTVFVSGVLLLFSICFSFALKRLRRKLLPVIPRPVIPDTDPHLDHQDLKEVTEEVHNVTLLYRDDVDKPSRCLNLEQSTMLHDCRHTSDEEEEDEEDEEMVAHFINSFPNPNYKGQMLRLSEPLEVAEKSQTESNCDISTPSYRPGSVL
ncbi:leukemia inhibitory factor receptor-like [Astyanax mexicanus]|uniref:Leukemia inhibitory factor receptor-like n=1 Tax=Astyanax mexicanus TaxID=7994 RepID=A0A8T2L422_ASTMX|nr:leukemia inhibitory factor receptor-like [Astyanax mexicanus]